MNVIQAKPADSDVANRVTLGKKYVVKSVFDDVAKYLAVRQFDVRLRTEAVKKFSEGLSSEHILDIGCGDGSISVPLLSSRNRLTLLDLSARMLSAARSKVPERLRDRVEIHNADFMDVCLPPASFDLVVCLGVMAHVDSPDTFLARIAEVTKPGGSLIVEFTDAFHPVGRAERVLGCLKRLIRRPRYAVNLLSAHRVFTLARERGFRLVSQYRYALPPVPGIWSLSHDARYRLIRWINGECDANRNAFWGNQYICLLHRTGDSAE